MIIIIHLKQQCKRGCGDLTIAALAFIESASKKHKTWQKNSAWNMWFSSYKEN